MEKSMFSVFDSKSRVFANPFTSINRFTAQRDFTRAANDPKSDLYAFPNDFSLFEIAKFDDILGIIIPHENPINLGTAAIFKEV